MLLARRGEGTSEWTLWIVVVACALHPIEEYFTGWQTWAHTALGITMPTSIFVAANAVLVVAAVLSARTGWRRPTLALIIPTATLVNAVLFHVLPTLLQGKVAPGLYTAVTLYLPFSSWALAGAARDGVPRSSITTAAIAGIVVALTVVMGARSISG
jgi:hypothetical protein